MTTATKTEAERVRCTGYADYEYRVNGVVLRVEQMDNNRWRWYCVTTGVNGIEHDDTSYRTKREAKAAALGYGKDPVPPHKPQWVGP